MKHEHLVLRANVPEEHEKLKKINPLARIPALETDDGMALVDSVTILDYLDRLVGPDAALTPSTGAVRTQMLSLIGIGAGAAEKSVSCYYEEGVNAKRPADKIYRPWVDKMYEQTKDGLEVVESMVKGPWIMGNKITQVDVSLVCFFDFNKDVAALDATTFAKEILAGFFSVQEIIVGADCRFGKGRAGEEL